MDDVELEKLTDLSTADELAPLAGNLTEFPSPVYRDDDENYGAGSEDQGLDSDEDDARGSGDGGDGRVVRSGSTSSTGGSCGLWCCIPNWMKRFSTPRWFLAFLCLFVTLQGITISGLNGVVIPAVEKRFRLSSSQAGFIPGSYDISAGLFVIPVSYFGERAHKPRWLGIGCAIFGIGAFVFALPEFVGGEYEVNSVQKLEYCRTSLNHTLYKSVCDDNGSSLYGLLIIGQLIMGLGAIPLYSLGIAFLDEIAGPASIHIYMGLFFIFSTIGPAMGFLVGSVFLGEYVDVGVSDHPPADNPNFVGRWWAGYVLTGTCSVLTSIPLLMFPKHLPGTAWIMEEKRRKQLGTGTSAIKVGGTFRHGQKMTRMQSVRSALLELLVMTKLTFALLFSPVLFSNIIGSSTEAFAVSGIIPFITTFFKTQFSVTTSTASLLTGSTIVVGVAGGILFSSWLLKYRKVYGARLAKYTAWTALGAVPFVFCFLVHCTGAPVVGVDRPYPNSTVLGSDRCQTNISHSCFAACGCVSERYDPVCGSDGNTYPTPCLAGCQAYHNGTPDASDDGSINRIYHHCTCIAESLQSANDVTGMHPESILLNATATVGACSEDCNLLPLFAILLTALMFLTFMNNVPAQEIVLQSVPADRRTLATGIQLFIGRFIANVPGPVLYGYLLDRGCLLWQLSCCEKGNCWVYSNAHMSTSLFAATLVCKCLSFIFFMSSWRFFVRDDKKKAAEGAKVESDDDH